MIFLAVSFLSIAYSCFMFAIPTTVFIVGLWYFVSRETKSKDSTPEYMSPIPLSSTEYPPVTPAPVDLGPVRVIPEATPIPGARAGRRATAAKTIKDLANVARGDKLQLTDHQSLLRGRALELRPKGLPFTVSHTTKILDQDGTPKALLISGFAGTSDAPPLMIALKETGKARSIALYRPDLEPSTRADTYGDIKSKWLFAKTRTPKGKKAVPVDPANLAFTKWFRRKLDGANTDHYDLKSELHGTAQFSPSRSDGTAKMPAILAEYSCESHSTDDQYLVLELGSNPLYSTIESYSGTKIRSSDIEIL